MNSSSASFSAGLLAIAVCIAGCGNDGTTGPSTTSSGGSGGSGASGSSSASSSGSGGTGGGATGSGGSDGGTQVTSTRVFVTSKTYDGMFGGLTGADAECQKLADAAALGGTWMAWLSDGSSVTPVDRLKHSTMPYVLIGGAQIAADWTDLLDGSIAVPIDHDETGTAIAANDVTKVWTGTNADGTMIGPSCSAWSTLGSGGTYGLTTASDSMWSFTSGNPCNSMDRLYCFEQ